MDPAMGWTDPGQAIKLEACPFLLKADSALYFLTIHPTKPGSLQGYQYLGVGAGVDGPWGCPASPP